MSEDKFLANHLEARIEQLFNRLYVTSSEGWTKSGILVEKAIFDKFRANRWTHLAAGMLAVLHAFMARFGKC